MRFKYIILTVLTVVGYPQSSHAMTTVLTNEVVKRVGTLLLGAAAAAVRRVSDDNYVQLPQKQHAPSKVADFFDIANTWRRRSREAQERLGRYNLKWERFIPAPTHPIPTSSPHPGYPDEGMSSRDETIGDGDRATQPSQTPQPKNSAEPSKVSGSQGSIASQSSSSGFWSGLKNSFDLSSDRVWTNMQVSRPRPYDTSFSQYQHSLAVFQDLMKNPEFALRMQRYLRNFSDLLIASNDAATSAARRIAARLKLAEAQFSDPIAYHANPLVYTLLNYFFDSEGHISGAEVPSKISREILGYLKDHDQENYDRLKANHGKEGSFQKAVFEAVENGGSDWFWPFGRTGLDELKSHIQEHPDNNDLLQGIAAFSQGYYAGEDFLETVIPQSHFYHSLFNTIHRDQLEHIKVSDPELYEHVITYDRWGIPRAYGNDPVWKNLPAAIKDATTDTDEKQRLLGSYFGSRHDAYEMITGKLKAKPNGQSDKEVEAALWSLVEHMVQPSITTKARLASFFDEKNRFKFSFEDSQLEKELKDLMISTFGGTNMDFRDNVKLTHDKTWKDFPFGVDPAFIESESKKTVPPENNDAPSVPKESAPGTRDVVGNGGIGEFCFTDGSIPPHHAPPQPPRDESHELSKRVHDASSSYEIDSPRQKPPAPQSDQKVKAASSAPTPPGGPQSGPGGEKPPAPEPPTEEDIKRCIESFVKPAGEWIGEKHSRKGAARSVDRTYEDALDLFREIAQKCFGIVSDTSDGLLANFGERYAILLRKISKSGPPTLDVNIGKHVKFKFIRGV